MSIGDFFWLLLLCLVAIFWWRTSEAKQIAHRLARRHCEQMGVQFLDDSVVLKRMRPQRHRRGQVVLQRTFCFEFASTGAERYFGEVVLLGYQLRTITLEPHRIPPESQ